MFLGDKKELPSKIEKELENDVRGLLDGCDPSTLPLKGVKMQALVAYTSFENTRKLIRWNKIMTFATVVLAGATVVLAVVTYLKT
jgi:hypothetical protein